MGKDSRTTSDLRQMHGLLSKNVHAVAGIGNPAKFYKTLSGLGLNPIHHSFPDHYQFL